MAFVARKGSWVRAAGLGIVAIFTLVAHTLIEPPGQIYSTWANNLSTGAPLYTVDPEHMHNLLDREAPILGNLATILSITVTGLLLVAAVQAIGDTQQPAHHRQPTSRHARNHSDGPRSRPGGGPGHVVGAIILAAGCTEATERANLAAPADG